MNQDLQQRIEAAIESCKKDGIDTAFSVITIAKGTRTLAAKESYKALQCIDLGNCEYRFIPLEGVRLSFLGTTEPNDDKVYFRHWYVVERPDGESFAVAHDVFGLEDMGAQSCDLVCIPEYLLQG